MNVTAHQEKGENEETKKGKRRAGEKKRENKRLILKKLCAALLWSFRGQHSEKMKGSARGNWDPRKGQQSFRPNPNGAGDRTTTLRRLLIGAVTLHCPVIKPGPQEWESCMIPLHLQCSLEAAIAGSMPNKMKRQPTVKKQRLVIEE